MTTELDTQIARLEATLRARSRSMPGQVGALHKELAVVEAQRWLVHPNTPPGMESMDSPAGAWAPVAQLEGRQAVYHLPAPSGPCPQVR